MQIEDYISIRGQVGACGHLKVFLGFAPAKILHEQSFADVLNEDTGEGYQRPRSISHSKSFKQYISQPNASTIPLTFNLRQVEVESWVLHEKPPSEAVLYLKKGVRSLAQVDCQHRLGELFDESISLAFMSFLGLDLRTEMALFNVINSRARGLSSSLTDYHETKLRDNLQVDAPHLLIAKRLNEDPDSPWYRMVRYGGETCSGLKRRTSFRMLQTSIAKLIRQTSQLRVFEINATYDLICTYWSVVREVFKKEWGDHRHHLLTKGVGLYSLMGLLADFANSANSMELTREWFQEHLRPLVGTIDWSSNGMFAKAGGKKGATEIHNTIRKVAGL